MLPVPPYSAFLQWSTINDQQSTDPINGPEDESDYLLIVTEDVNVNITMEATVIPADPVTPETFDIVHSLVSWETPTGNIPPGGGTSGFTLTGILFIPALSYWWVINETEYSATTIGEVPLTIDFLTKYESNPVPQKTFEIVVQAVATGSIGTILNETQTYTIIIQNTWDFEKIELNELLARGSL